MSVLEEAINRCRLTGMTIAGQFKIENGNHGIQYAARVQANDKEFIIKEQDGDIVKSELYNGISVMTSMMSTKDILFRCKTSGRAKSLSSPEVLLDKDLNVIDIGSNMRAESYINNDLIVTIGTKQVKFITQFSVFNIKGELLFEDKFAFISKRDYDRNSRTTFTGFRLSTPDSCTSNRERATMSAYTMCDAISEASGMDNFRVITLTNLLGEIEEFEAKFEEETYKTIIAYSDSAKRILGICTTKNSNCELFDIKNKKWICTDDIIKDTYKLYHMQ